ncbi:1-aminocyclopropane-1-carboxylate synthase-like 1, partial [Plakobranchus ocellatus]
GIIPFGLAENKIGIDVLFPQLEAIASRPDERHFYNYSKMTGEDSFRLSLKKFLEHEFHPLHELDVNTLFVTNGVTAILENLAFALAQPGEYFMVVRPYYYRLYLDFFERAGVKILPVDQPLPSETADNRYALDVSALERAMKQASSEGKVVRAINITNPSNPTGDVYTAEELKELLDFAHRYKLHVIANELYGLSMFDPKVNFTSVLSLPMPDPERVHFLWGFSKDFGLSGLRISTIYTRSPGVARFCRQTGIYLRPTGIGQSRVQPIIDDLENIDSRIFPELRRKIAARRQSVKEAIEECGGRVHPSPATIFRWIDLSSFLLSPDWEGEHQLFLRIFSAGVHLVEGSSLGHSVPGWFRMITALEDEVHAEGMKRLVAVLKSIRLEKEEHQQQQQ